MIQAERRFATFVVLTKVGTALSADWMRPSRSATVPLSGGKVNFDHAFDDGRKGGKNVSGCNELYSYNGGKYPGGAFLKMNLTD
jgi:hypothetical protein